MTPPTGSVNAFSAGARVLVHRRTGLIGAGCSVNAFSAGARVLVHRKAGVQVARKRAMAATTLSMSLRTARAEKRRSSIPASNRSF